jgi:hypothetical protein
MVACCRRGSQRQTVADDEDHDNRIGCENEQQRRGHYAKHRDKEIDYDNPRKKVPKPHNDSPEIRAGNSNRIRPYLSEIDS